MFERAVEFLEHGIVIDANTPLGILLAIGILIAIPRSLAKWVFWLAILGLILNLIGVNLGELLR